MPTNVLLVKNSSLVGLYWGRYFEMEQDTVHQSLSWLIEAAETGRFDIHKTRIKGQKMYRLAEAPEALCDLAAGKTAGKVVLDCRGPSELSRL